MEKEICLFIADSNGCYPVPASKGGAVSTLVELLISGNDKKKLAEFTVVSYYEKNAYELSKKYSNVNFVWIKIPWLIKMLDAGLFWAVSTFTNIKASSFKSLWALLFYTLKSSFILRKKKFDTIVLEHNIPMVWMIQWSGFKGKYFHHLHNLPRTNAKCRKGLEKCVGFICISRFMADDIMSVNSPIGPVEHGKVKLLFNCIDTKLFKPIPKSKLSFRKSDFGILKDSRVLIFAGRITWEKGIDKILEAFDFIQNENVELLVVGNIAHEEEKKEPYIKRLMQLSQKYKNKIHFTGYVEHNKLPELYNLADIAVLPSMWEEPAGLTMLEAMACGVPVITTRSGGIPEYVGDAAIVLERNGGLPQNIANCIDSLLSDKYMYRMYSQKGVGRINSMFSSEQYIDKFNSIVS